MVFVSHASSDYGGLKDWVDFFEGLGLKCWISERDLPQTISSWSHEIMRVMESCNTVLLYLTRNSIQSEQVMNEVHNASAMGKNMIPVFAEDVKPSDDLIYLIRKYEWILAYKYTDRSSLENVLRARLLENSNDDRDRFWNAVGSEAYREFVHAVLLKYYGDSFFTLINGELLPVYSVKAKPRNGIKTINDYDGFCDYENSKLADFDVHTHQGYVKLKWYEEYARILDGKIRYPNRPGYMLDEFVLDEDGTIDKIRTHVGTYAENVYSTHVLEYEMYRVFLQYGNANLDDPVIWSHVREAMEIRNRMHADVDSGDMEIRKKQMCHSLLHGYGRDSLLSVQMVVVIKSNRTHRYEVKFIQRSNQVAAKPGIYQFVPSGGFEILNDSDDDVYDDLELEENFSLGCAIFREYIEELFNVPEFEGGGSGSVEDRLLKDPHVVAIEDMLSRGTAEFLFLGSVVSLEGLRHELSFALVIHDEAYSENRFLANEECKKGKVNSVPLHDFPDKRVVWRQLHEPSAALWDLFAKTDLYKKIVSNG